MKVSTPAEVKSRRESSMAVEIAALINRIEAVLDGRYRAEHWFSVGGYDPATLEVVADKYRAAGWIVTVVSDQRDGDALVIKAP